MKRLIVYVILAAASMHIALIYRNLAFLSIFYGQLFVVLLLAILNIISICHLEIFMNISENVVQIGQKIHVYITINNRSIFPTGKIEVKVNSFNLYSGKKEATKFYGSADGYSSAVLKCSYITKNPGNIEFSIKKVWSNDFLGILRLPLFKNYIYKYPIIVIPELYEVPVFIGKSQYRYIFENEAVQNSFKNSGNDTNSENRPYIVGDSFKDIHWKLSAKTDELMVRQKYGNFSSGTVFFLDLGTVKSDYIKKCFIQAVLSISTSLLYNECSHYICWYDTKLDDIAESRIEQENDSYSIVQECIDKMSEKHRENTDIYILKNMYARKYNVQGSFAYLALNTEFELYVNDSKIIQYDYNNLKESILSTEVQL